ncbi:hypothetical protein AURANDRAFT_66384 [Aureococcus anophagefferens]|uniref:Uncharacterized protein n=1 Tax=Aureococcus anophagefferens TaxID=44056 RepID=F0YHC7_AURAN|nr:hypothetical protein AURANDRAFT_66384 [Aureococcus anophagefferens]EGB05422.1 hypothetical protein AURANDRAFT_66384 [Aureococcus anophagefferens]|eukprot:XP_009039805.1 hypothetical protein AURANDRAFT_66384 [Aureococcus anophagefferens]
MAPAAGGGGRELAPLAKMRVLRFAALASCASSLGKGPIGVKMVDVAGDGAALVVDSYADAAVLVDVVRCAVLGVRLLDAGARGTGVIGCFPPECFVAKWIETHNCSLRAHPRLEYGLGHPSLPTSLPSLSVSRSVVLGMALDTIASSSWRCIRVQT